MTRPARGALYDRRSHTWKHNNQMLVLLGGPRAAILQVCDPGVAAGVESYSTYKTDPLGRLERTLDSMMAISFAPPAERERVLAGLEKAHSRVAGTLEDGTPYSALDADRQYWVLATLTDTVIEVDRRYLGKMRRADREVYYEESKRMADAFGIPASLVPDDYAAFGDYVAGKVASLVPTDDSRKITRELMSPRIRGVPGIAWLPFNLVTSELLPTRLRRELGLGDLNAIELAAVRTAQLSLRNSVAHIPTTLRSTPFGASPSRRAA